MSTTAPAALIAGQTTSGLIESYRLTDDLMVGASAQEYATLAKLRGWISEDLDRRYPGVLDAWCEALDNGEDADLMDLYEQAAD